MVGYKVQDSASCSDSAIVEWKRTGETFDADYFMRTWAVKKGILPRELPFFLDDARAMFNTGVEFICLRSCPQVDTSTLVEKKLKTYETSAAMFRYGYSGITTTENSMFE
jgi:hypothetical protein